MQSRLSFCHVVTITAAMPVAAACDRRRRGRRRHVLICPRPRLVPISFALVATPCIVAKSPHENQPRQRLRHISSALQHPKSTPLTHGLLLSCFTSSTPQPVAFASHLPKPERFRHGDGSGALAALASQVPLRLASASQLHLLDSQW